MNYSSIEEKKCRYCLETDNEFDLLSPCKCSGTIKYIHKYCLQHWFNSLKNKIIFPFRANRFELQCEICKTPYKMEIVERKNKNNILPIILKYFFCISFFISIYWLSHRYHISNMGITN